jgi:hypothetical protein
MEDYVEGRINIEYGREPLNRGRDDQRGDMREIHGRCMGKMANTAVLILVEVAVPVAGGLKREAHHPGGQKDGQKPAQCLRLDEQPPKTPRR